MGSKSSVPPESDIYDISPQESAPVKPARSPAAQPVALPYRTAPKKAAGLSTDTEVLKNVQIPLVLLTVGVLVQLVAAWFGEGSVAAVAIDLVLRTAVTLVAVLIAARLRAIELGKFRYTLLKLAALCVFPSAMLMVAMIVLRFIPLFGLLIGLIGEFVLYFALLGVLFDLEESDTWYCVFIIFLVNLGVYFPLKYFLPMS